MIFAGHASPSIKGAGVRGKDTPGLHGTLRTGITPFDVGTVLLLKYGDGLSIDDKLPILSALTMPLNLP